MALSLFAILSAVSEGLTWFTAQKFLSLCQGMLDDEKIKHRCSNLFNSAFTHTVIDNKIFMKYQLTCYSLEIV